MNCVVVHAHPNPDSFSHALRQRAVDTLAADGHGVDVIDLYDINYQPCLTEVEHRQYNNLYADSLDAGGLNRNGADLDQSVAHHIALVAKADAMIFVYPTWWSGLPAILKGWLERTMLPGFAFELATDNQPESSPGSGPLKVQPRLTNVKHLVGITTYGSGPLEVRLLGDGGRRTITRTVRALCGANTTTTWLGLHRLDSATDAGRAEFLDKVAARLQARLRQPTQGRL